MNLNFDLLATKEIYVDKAYQLREYYSCRSVVQLHRWIWLQTKSHLVNLLLSCTVIRFPSKTFPFIVIVYVTGD